MLLIKDFLNCQMTIGCSFIFNNESPKICLEILPMGGVYMLVFFPIEWLGIVLKKNKILVLKFPKSFQMVRIEYAWLIICQPRWERVLRISLLKNTDFDLISFFLTFILTFPWCLMFLIIGHLLVTLFTEKFSHIMPNCWCGQEDLMHFNCTFEDFQPILFSSHSISLPCSTHHFWMSVGSSTQSLASY